MKKRFGFALALMATLAGGGLALAQAAPFDTPPVDAPPVDTPPVDTPPVDTPPVDTPPVDTPPVDTPPVDTPPVDLPAEEDVAKLDADGMTDDASAAEDTHGAAVSAAARETCPEGPEHGACVSEVARDHDGDGTPDVGPGPPGFEDELPEQAAAGGRPAGAGR